jgi:hypothetical protein
VIAGDLRDPAPVEIRDCNTCRCLDIMADRAWVSDETGSYRDESALSDVRVRRRKHRAEGECSRPQATWGGEPEVNETDQGEPGPATGPEALEPAESGTARLRAATQGLHQGRR